MIRLSTISSRVRLIVGVLTCLIISVDGVSQTPYTGYFIAPNTIGGQTDDYLNIKPRSGVGETNSWNVYHKDNSPLLSVYFGKATPYIHIGQNKVTNLYVNGQVGIGTTAPQEALHIMGSIRGNSPGGSLRINTQHGWVEVGPQNGVYAHFYTSMAAFFFDKSIDVNGYISSYSGTDLRLRTNSTERITVLNSNGNVGVGTTTPQERFHVSGGNLIVDNTKPYIYTGVGTTDLNRYIYIANSPGTTLTSGIKAGGVLVSDSHDYANPSKNDLIVKGVVAIGTPITSYANNYSLAVNGKIGAKDIQIESKSWPDYVFASDYKLPSLSEVEQYILKNKHLQDMPSAEEVSKNGYSVSEVETAMLKKIEELTLYVIELQKQVDSLNAKLEKR